ALLVAVGLAACSPNVHGPWVDENGRRLMGSEVVEYRGFPECDQELVTFMRFFGDQYARDPEGVLGPLRSPVDDDPLAYAVLDSLPEGAEGTDITHGGREIYVAADRPDYLYIRLADGDVER
ncbi:MAG: hypothetical protein GWN79_13675, partial [Actinobacteria bacterium]|nr:hypothetical protein [Actinomycetota bacterium]NIS32618.1 hypothetical protein [Actinomycetota bacterium]NIT96367.1 hypothetical protein [Actinomycetota bacterium]NIU20072.1 hypothetical protein [Actinomycetota bacterium]NIU67624.1 hypothetical protein [Actinomycetota bacterium]